jgi:predicted dehydrogenase
MPESIRVGLIGTSWYMDAAHLPMLKADPRVTLAAICGRNRERAQDMASKYGIPAVFTDYRAMIARSNLQAIVIATPDDEHYAMTMDALDAGLHVICEKPLALNATHARAMYEKAEAQGVRHMTFFTWRWMPHYRYGRELIDQGALGRLYDCQFNFLMGYGRNHAYQWRFDRQRANGIVGDSGAHMFDLAHYLVGDITRVSAHLSTHMPRDGVNAQPLDPASDSAMALIEFANGVQGTVHVSALARIHDPILEQHITLHGDAGSLIADLTPGSGLPQLQLAQGDEPYRPVTLPDRFLTGIDVSQPIITQFLSMFTAQPIGCRLFVDAILDNRPITPSFYEGWKAQLVIDATIAAHESGQWIDI